jgi:hypothetical protein
MSPAPLTPILGSAAIGVGYAGSSDNLQSSTPVPFAASAGNLQQKFARRLRPAAVQQAIRRFFQPVAGDRRQRAAKFAAANRCLSLKIDAANPAFVNDQPLCSCFVLKMLPAVKGSLPRAHARHQSLR